ncbi:hypothetical protein H0H92_008622 [Tricholoma furcatifolium]|nr:hypothetical protein H0H92_008622 [Tricholoma furcatifolium]
MDLPAEIWAHIFDIAADEDVIFQYGLPTMMSESIWVKGLTSKWALRRPSDSLNYIQRSSYATKKAIISTCKSWHKIATELLFRCLFFNEPKNLLSLCEILDSVSSAATTISSSLGWWTKRIHVCRYTRSTTMAGLDKALNSIIQRCPNLEIFIVDVPMGETFGPVADTLATYTLKSLRTVHWNVSCELLPKVIWALDSLPSIIVAQIDFDSKSHEDLENVPLGSASDLQISLPHLQQLSLRGLFSQFLEEATGWTFPSLQCLSLDSINHRTDIPDVSAFLAAHGSELTFLDLNCIPTLDVPEILDLCPKLLSFSFNADWRLQPPDEAMPADGSLTVHMATNEAMSTLVYTPHPNIEVIGIHGLMYAFGVGYAAQYAAEDPLRAHVIGRSNDLNIAALNKTNFPRLHTVRALSRAMLSDLNDADGPSEEGGMERYDKWWDMLTAQGIRLEDCTGALLGTLPKDEDVEPEDEDAGSDDDMYEEDEGSDGDLEEEEEIERELIPQWRAGHGIAELRDLLDQCRMMELTREPSIFAPMFPEPAPPLAIYPPT